MPKILIIDDDEDLRSLLTIYFEGLGFNATCANDGDEGLTQAREHQPDVIILDINMPTLDGFNTLRALKNNAATEHIPVVVLSSFDHVDNRTMVHKTGCAAFVNKPVELDQLRNFVERALNDSNS